MTGNEQTEKTKFHSAMARKSEYLYGMSELDKRWQIFRSCLEADTVTTETAETGTVRMPDATAYRVKERKNVFKSVNEIEGPTTYRIHIGQTGEFYGKMFTVPDNADVMGVLEERGVINGKEVFGGFFLSENSFTSSLDNQYDTMQLLLSTVVSCNAGRLLVQQDKGMVERKVQMGMHKMQQALETRSKNSSIYTNWKGYSWLDEIFLDIAHVFREAGNSSKTTRAATDLTEEIKVNTRPILVRGAIQAAMQLVNLIASWLMTQKDDQKNVFMSVAEICMQFQKVRQFVLAKLQEEKGATADQTAAIRGES